MRLHALALILIFSPSVAVSESIQKRDWLQNVHMNLPILLCVPKGYFRQCFSVSVQECEGTALAATKDCIEKYSSQLPDVMSLPKDGQDWGRTIGTCAGARTELALVRKRVNNPKCADSRNFP
jgi:hypothetical protein